MLLADIGDTSYNIFLFLHILTAIIGLAPAVVDPVVAMQWADDKDALRKFAGTMAKNNQRIFGNSIILSGILGFGLVSMSGDDIFEMSQTWVWLAIIVFIAMIGVLHGILIPGAKAFAEGDDSAQEKLEKLGPIFTLLTLVMLYLMVFKPGGPF